MNLTIEIPDDLAAALQAQALAQGLSPDRLISRVLAATFAPPQEQTPTVPFETGYGMLAKYGPAPSAEEIEENRREMFRNFAQAF